MSSSASAKSMGSSGSIGKIRYKVVDVEGDGNCFFRAVFHLIMNASEHVKQAFGLKQDSTEDDGVRILRAFVAYGVKHGAFGDATATIDNLCALIDQAARGERRALMRDLHDMYPFVTSRVCGKSGNQRYDEVAKMIANTKTPVMYACALEMDVIKQALASAQTNITLVTISNSRKWKKDLIKSVEGIATPYAVVLLNEDNYHYKYLMFKTGGMDKYSTLLSRADVMQVSSVDDIAKSISAMRVSKNKKRSSTAVSGVRRSERLKRKPGEN